MNKAQMKFIIKKMQEIKVLEGEQAAIAQRKFIRQAKEMKEMQYLLAP